MAQYEIILKECSNLARTVATVRKFNPASISAIRKNLGSDNPVISIRSWDYPLNLGMSVGLRWQHLVFLEAVAELLGQGAVLRLRYCAAPGCEPREVDLPMVHNLMRSEIESLDQEHD
jgi:hypothetical protein